MFCNSFTGGCSASHFLFGVQIGKENLVKMDTFLAVDKPNSVFLFIVTY